MMQRSAVLRLAVAFALVVAVTFGARACAQSVNAGEISGLVTDTSGAAIPGTTVTVLNVNTGVSKDYQTNQDGLYDTSSIVAGTYKITFSKEGFASMVRSSITIVVGNTTINAQLKVGSVTEAVVVNADVPLLKTESGEQTTTLSAETLQQLPQVGQDWSSFSILLPGAAGVPMGAQGSVGSGTSNGTTLSVNGNLPFSTVLSDGAETTLPASANSDINIQETIQEVQISTSAFSAQYGVGGILYNQISKGGTDGFHGSAYEYFQNDALNAYNYAFGQSISKSVLRYHNFGGSIGGPIIRRKLFFYFDFDKIIQHGGNQAVFYNVPTPAVLSGDFTGYPTLYDPATNHIQATGTYLYPGQSKASTCPCVIRTSFAAEYGNGNKIPASRIDSVAKNIQGYFPASNTAGNLGGNGQITGNYTYTSPASNPFTKYFGRLDYNISANNRLTMSVTDGDNPGESFGAGICPINCQSNDVSRVNSQITDVWTISPRITNELRLGYTNQLNFFVPGTLNQGYPGKLGWQFAKADNFPSINIANYNNSNNPNGDTVVTSNINAVYKEHAFDPSDVVTMIVGKHILHFGGEFLIYQNNSTAWGNVNAGSMSYTGQYTSEGFASDLNSSSTGWGYADFLLGQTQQWNARVTPEYGGRMKLPQMFVQDDYKVSPKLTVNLGLRYQIQTGWSEVKGNEASFDPRVANPATGTLGAMWYGSTKANGRDSIQAPVYNTFLPRVGFAYMLDPKTTLRGGFGLYAYNWSNDTYNGNNISNIMGGAFGGNGSVVDNTNYTPVVVLSQNGSSLPFIQSSTNPAAFNGQTVAFAAYHQPVGGSYQWNIQAQRELNNDTVVSLAYVASHGHDLPFPVDINQVPENRLGAGGQQFRPYPQFGTIAVAGVVPGENATSNYNSLQAAIEKRMTHGLNFNFNYVWSHFLDDLDSSGWGSHAGAQNWQRAYDPHANYGNSNFDIRNAFKGSIVYQLPFGEGKQFLNNNRILDTVIGGWQAASTIIIQSGQPFTPTIAGADGALSLSDPNTHYTWYPNLVGNPVLSGRGTEHWFNEAAFAIPAQATFGNAHRNQLVSPGFNRVNISVGKSFRIYEQYRLQIRADANNAFNHPSFGIPTTDLSAGPNGFVTGTSKIRTVTDPGRTMQLSARFSF
jgi:hypothetical protein